MRIPLLSDRRCDMLAALVCVVVALSCASFMPTIVGQKVVDLSVAYSLPQGFFILNVKDNGILGANHSWSLSGGIPINKALVNTEYYLFNLTYNRTTSGGITPPNFDASQTFEINLLGTIGGADGGLKEWNVYGYGDQVDLWTVRTNTAEPNALFSFDLVDQTNKVYIIRYNLDRNQCVTTTRGGLDFVLAPYSVNNASQQFQLIDAFNPNPPSPVAGGELLDVGAGYSLANGFFISNVLDNAILGANHSWSLTGGIPYAKAVVNSEYYLFNLTFNRTSTGGNAPPNFDSSKYFEVNLLSTLTLPDGGLKQWNVYGWRDQVDLYTVRNNTAEQNALFAFDLVDQANKVYVIRTRLNAANCVSTIGGGVDFVVKPCQAGNNAFRFQLINPFPGSGDTSSSSDSNFFSTAGGVIVILIIIAVCLGGAYAGWRFYQKWSHTTKHHKSGTSEPALLASLTTNGAEQDHEEAQGSYRKIGDNMELGNVQENNGHTSNSARASTRGTSPNDDY